MLLVVLLQHLCEPGGASMPCISLALSLPAAFPAAEQTGCLRAASNCAAKISHPDSITLRSRYVRTRNCTYRLSE